MMAVDESGQEISLGMQVIYGSPDPAELAAQTVTVVSIDEDIHDGSDDGEPSYPILVVTVVFPDGDKIKLYGRHSWKHSEDHREPTFEVSDLTVPDALARFWFIDNALADEPSLPVAASCQGGTGPFLLPIVDEEYGGVIAWANTPEQATRIVEALTKSGVA